MSQWISLYEHIPAMLMVIFRIGGLMIFGPIFGSPGIPVKVKVLLSFTIGAAIYPLMLETHGLHTAATLTIWSLAPLIASEFMIGLIIGYIASMPMITVQTSGLIMGQQMGLGFASFYNPGIGDEADVVGQLMFYMALAGFLLIGGHEMMLIGVMHSFGRVPLGGFAPDITMLTLLSGILISSFEVALRIAGPLLAMIFLESIAMGFISKTVPQMNILSLGFPLRILAGFAIVAMGLVVINDVVMDDIEEIISILFTYLDSLMPNAT